MDQETANLLTKFLQDCYKHGLTDDEVKTLWFDSMYSTDSDDDARFLEDLNKAYDNIVKKSDALAKQGMQAPHIQEYLKKMKAKYGDDII